MSDHVLALVKDLPESKRKVRAVRPILRLEILSSLVPGDPNDKGRRYALTLGADDGMAQGAGLIWCESAGKVISIEGPVGIRSLDIQDGFLGQTLSLDIHASAVSRALAARVRPMDRVIASIIHPTTGAKPWPLFDGVVRPVSSSVRGENSTMGFSIQATGIQTILQSTAYNWQGFIHPDDTILATTDGKTLLEQLGKAAIPPHKVVEIFLQCALKRAMGIRFGATVSDFATDAGTGLGVLDYVKPSPTWWSSVTDVGYPLAWELIQAQTGSTFWAILQALSEPGLHEFFVGIESGGPALIHRPRPFPGLPRHDGRWRALPVVEIGGDAPTPREIGEALEGAPCPNVFHWAGIGLGDASKEIFQSKLVFGHYRSEALINRYGYVSHGLSSKCAPIAGGDRAKDYMTWCAEALQHYAAQEIARPLMRSRTYQLPFLAVRPGMALVDRTLDDVATGYVTSTSFRLAGTGSSFQMGMTIKAERVVKGTDAAGYPDAVRVLVPDLQRVAYAGQDLGPAPKAPAVGGAYAPAKFDAPKRGSLPADLVKEIREAAAKWSVPGWVIAHVLHNETAFGRNMGNASRAKNGIAQITSEATSDLIQVGLKNRDGLPFRPQDKTDRAKCIWACAAFLRRCEFLLVEGGMPATAESRWSWVLRAYRWGAGSTLTHGRATRWSWGAGEAFPDYRRYWSPRGVASGQASWGWI